MLRKEQNKLITRTGPNTPMGRLFRCYQPFKDAAKEAMTVCAGVAPATV
jgi:hypothetical protein